MQSTTDRILRTQAYLRNTDNINMKVINTTWTLPFKITYSVTLLPIHMLVQI